MQNVTKEIADSIGLDRPIGALVADVAEGGPAAQAGLKRGDVITAIDGQPVEDSGGVSFRLGERPLGGVASLSVLRAGKTIVLSLKLAAAPEIPPRDAIRIKTRSPFEGAIVMNISPALIEEMSIDNAHEGVIVAEVAEGSTAANVGLQKGDLVLSVNDAKIATTRDLEKAAASRPRYWKLAIGRGGEVIQTVFGG